MLCRSWEAEKIWLAVDFSLANQSVETELTFSVTWVPDPTEHLDYSEKSKWGSEAHVDKRARGHRKDREESKCDQKKRKVAFRGSGSIPDF